MRRGFALIWGLVTVAVAAIVGAFSYQAGWAAGIASKLPEGAAAPYYAYEPHFVGFGFFGLLPLLFFVLLLFVLFRAARRGPWGWGGYRGYGGGTPPPQMEDRLQEWHRRAHTEQPKDTTQV